VLFCSLSRNFRASSQPGGDPCCVWVKYNHTKPLHTKESIMKVRKNLEAVFLVAAFVSTFAVYATAEVPVVRAAVATASQAVHDGNMQTVVVKAKRMTAAEKLAAQ
jgi:hypothetical protein